jgi:hypothetical protein
LPFRALRCDEERLLASPAMTTDLEDALAAYIIVLAESAASTHRAEDRPQYEKHLAVAARMYAALRSDATLQTLRALINTEIRAYGWSFLSDDEGRRVEAAWGAFVAEVDRHERNASAEPGASHPPVQSVAMAPDETLLRGQWLSRTVVPLRTPLVNEYWRWSAHIWSTSQPIRAGGLRCTAILQTADCGNGRTRKARCTVAARRSCA